MPAKLDETVLDALKIAFSYMPNAIEVTRYEYGDRHLLVLEHINAVKEVLLEHGIDPDEVYGEVHPDDFMTAGDRVNLTPQGRKRFIGAFERRIAQEITHPVFGYKVSYRRLLELQARLLGRFLAGEIPDYPAFVTR